MIGYHCGKRTIPYGSNPVYFRRRCVVCLKIFKQRKRLKKSPTKVTVTYEMPETLEEAIKKLDANYILNAIREQLKIDAIRKGRK